MVRSIARLAIYLVGLLLIVGAAWVFLTQTDIGEALPAGVALALLLLLVGIGVMASATYISGGYESRRVVREGAGERHAHERLPEHDRHVTYEERRFD